MVRPAGAPVEVLVGVGIVWADADKHIDINKMLLMKKAVS